MPNDLKHKTLRGFFWSFIDGASLQTIQFLFFLILARFLSPKEFGLIGMLTIFINVAQSLVDSGFSQALVQKKEASYIDECSIFYFNLAISISGMFLLCAISPFIASFYGQPILISVTRVLSLNLIINAFSIVPIALLHKQINFKIQFKVNIISFSISGAISITMAFLGYGVWCLVAQSLIVNSFRAILLWTLFPWRPSFIFSIKSLRAMFGFGSRVALSGLINTIFKNIYMLVIGKFYSAVSLGYYTTAKKIQNVPPLTISSMVNRVFFPVMSTVQEDKERAKDLFKKVLKVVAFINIPLMMGLSTIAKPLVVIILTDKWLQAAEYLQLLCIIGILVPFQALNLNALKSQGRSDLILQLEVLKKMLVLLNILITYRWGIKALISGQIILSLFGFFLNSFFISKLIKYSFKQQVFDMSPYLFISMIMSLVVFSMKFLPFFNENYLLLVIAQILSAASVYFFLNYFFKTFAIIEIFNILKDKALRSSDGPYHK